jgi:uncharacterized membrane protein
MTRPLTNWHTRTTRDRTTGQRAADILRNGMGSWPFVFSFLGFMVVWAYLQGAILLIAAKRQDAISASLAQHDYETNVAAAREIEQLLEINRRQLELLERLVAERDGGTRQNVSGDGVDA